jgi:hypothetical protein
MQAIFATRLTAPPKTITVFGAVPRPDVEIRLPTAAQRALFVLDFQTGLGKEGLYQLRPPSQAGDSEVEFLMQLLQIQAHHVARLHVLEMVPAPLIPRVEVRSVARQRFQPDLAARVRHELLNFRPPVDGGTVPDHQQPLAGHAQQVQQKLDAVQPVERLLPGQRVDLALRSCQSLEPKLPSPILRGHKV